MLSESAFACLQEVLVWLTGVMKEIGGQWTEDSLKDFVWNTLKAGGVMPGYGHAVLRKTGMENIL